MKLLTFSVDNILKYNQPINIFFPPIWMKFAALKYFIWNYTSVEDLCIL